MSRNTTDHARHIRRGIMGKAVDAFLDQLGSQCVELQRLAAGIPLGESEVYGALLEECG